MKKISAVLASGLLLASFATPAFAATLAQEEHVAISIPINDDLYAAGGSVTVGEQVDGDVIAAAGDIKIEEAVKEDVSAAGGTVIVNAAVGDDVRVAGGDVSILSTVGGDVIAMGGRVTIGEESIVNGDVIVMGGDITIDGTVRGDLTVYGGQVRIDGTVEGTTHVESDHVMAGGTFNGETTFAAVNLGIGLDANFNENVSYWTENGEMDFGETLAAGKTATYDPELRGMDLPNEAKAAGALAIFVGVISLFSVLSGALIIFLLVLATNKIFPALAQTVDKQPLWTLFLGTMFFICTPILSVFLMVTIVGIPLGLYGLMIFAFSLYFAKIFTAMMCAKWIQLRSGKKWNKPIFFLLSLLLFIALKILTIIPILGWLLQAILIFMTFGALLMYKAEAWKKYS